jgi:hypothetical protein
MASHASEQGSISSKDLNDPCLTIMLAPKLRLRTPWIHVHVTSLYADPKLDADALRSMAI